MEYILHQTLHSCMHDHGFTAMAGQTGAAWISVAFQSIWQHTVRCGILCVLSLVWETEMVQSRYNLQALQLDKMGRKWRNGTENSSMYSDAAPPDTLPSSSPSAQEASSPSNCPFLLISASGFFECYHAVLQARAPTQSSPSVGRFIIRAHP